MNMLSFLDIHNVMVTIPVGTTPYEMSWIEALAAIFCLLRMWLATIEKTANYLFGCVHLVLFGVIFYQLHLYALVLLQCFFLLANVYGWFAWSRQTKNGKPLAIRWLQPEVEMVVMIVTCLTIGVLTVSVDHVIYFISSSTVSMLSQFNIHLSPAVMLTSESPFLYSAIIVLSVVAFILMTRKYVESWIFWGMINIVCIAMYANQGVYVLMAQSVILLCISVHGIQTWGQSVKNLAYVPSYSKYQTKSVAH